MWIYFNDESIAYSTNPLHHAVEQSNIKFAQLLIKSGIDLEMKNSNGLTPLHSACTYGNMEMVQLLIKHTPTFDATSRTNEGETIFHFAVQNSDPQIPKLILDTFRFEDIRDEEGWTMLHDAVAHGEKETIEFLIESRHKLGINIEAKTNNGKTILHVACRHKDIKVVNLIDEALEEINSDIGFDTRCENQLTPLHYAIMNKTSDVAIRLLETFPDDFNVLAQYGTHVLHFVCHHGHLNLLKHMFDYPNIIDFNVADQGGTTPLHFACHAGQFEVVKFLLENSNEKGIDIYKINIRFKTAEDYARQNGYEEIVKLFAKFKLA